MNALTSLLNRAFDKNIPSLDPKYPCKQEVHRLIQSWLPSADRPLASAASHHFSQPGKMLRAEMALRAASAFQVEREAAVYWAASIEVLHNASLIHDDICDGDKQRRGQQSVWTKFGRNAALALGDWLISVSFQLASHAADKANAPRLVRLLAQHMATTTAGEALEFEMDHVLDWNTYFKIASDKTTPLLTAPIQGIAVMAGDIRSEVTVGHYFNDLGQAYQIANDILNFNGCDGAELIAGDLARRAPNAVVVSFKEILKGAQLTKFQNWFDSGDNLELTFWKNEILRSEAMKGASQRMFVLLKRAERKAGNLDFEFVDSIAPVHSLIQKLCMASVAEKV